MVLHLDLVRPDIKQELDQFGPCVFSALQVVTCWENYECGKNAEAGPPKRPGSRYGAPPPPLPLLVTGPCFVAVP